MADQVHMPPVPGVAFDNDDVVVTDEVGGVVLLPDNPNRRSALIINTGPESMRVTTDGSAPSLNHGKLVGPGSFLSLTSPYCPVDVIKAFSADPGTTANASEVI